MSYINRVGVDNLTAEISEAILAAVELTCLAAEARERIEKAGEPSENQMLALVRIEGAAARAVARLNALMPAASLARATENGVAA
jgi:hypothetical protein